MKNILLILLSLISITISAQDIGGQHYVAPSDSGGVDGTAGTYLEPWATWDYAMENAVAGDTIYFRGGVYMAEDFVNGSYIDVTYLIGTKEAPTCFFNYPGEKPILDGSLRKGSQAGYNTAMQFGNSHYVKFRGLTIQNFRQSRNAELNGLKQSHLAVAFGTNGTNYHFENCTAHDIGGRGWYNIPTADRVDSSAWINCDAFNCIDSFSYYHIEEERIDNRANGGDGYFIQVLRQIPYPFSTDPNEPLYYSHLLMEGCRAWACCDDGINLDGNAVMEVNNCWSFNNNIYLSSFPKSEGNGIKLGVGFPQLPGMIGYNPNVDTIFRIIKNCIVANCNFAYDHNNALDNYWPRSQIYNCLSYNNFNGIVIQNINRDDIIDVNFNTYRNFISYKDTNAILNVPILQQRYDYIFTEDHNTWKQAYAGTYGWEPNPNFDVNDDDFVSLDVSQLDDDRQKDGSLPIVTFGHLAKGSDLIDKGVYVELPYADSLPDLGPFEFGFEANVPPTVKITSPNKGSKFTLLDSIIITADASDSNGEIIKVEFFNDTIWLGEDSSEPYSYTWNSPLIGIHSLKAVATDNQKAKVTSLPVNVTVGPNNNVLYPNPNSGTFKFFMIDPPKTKCDIYIVSSDGRIVYNETLVPTEIIEIDVPDIGPGIYVLFLHNKERFISNKFVKL